MKRCPKCSQTFEDGDLYCLDDGNVLETVPSRLTNETPTQIVSPFPLRPVTRPPQRGGLLHIALGALGMGVIALGVAVYFLLPSDKPTDAKQAASGQTKNTNKADSSQLLNRPLAEESLTPTPTQESVTALIERWRLAQNTRNFREYQDCFDTSFFGIKRTKTGGPQRMNFGSWMNDRRKMLPNVIEVGVSNMQISFDGDTAIARFDQRFRSANHADDGLKEIRVKMFPAGPKIVFEELKQVY